MGSNMAEAHPVGFQWVMEAKARGTQVVHIDPRFTRTSAVADRYVSLRVGQRHRVPRRGDQLHPVQRTGLPGVRHRIHERVVHRRRKLPGTPRISTDCSAGTTTRPRPTTRRPGTTSRRARRATARTPRTTAHRISTAPAAPPIEGGAGDIPTDPTLQHPRCVYQILKRHYARYTPEMVERICGVPAEEFLQIAKAWAENSGRERTSALVYSMGWTQHSVGAQYIRTGGDHPAAAGQHR